MARGGRIAVVLIHGIGEQRPMETLRSFVDALAKEEGGNTTGNWPKPDPDADLFDTRCIVFEGTRTRPVVDFYEFYWAHLAEGNRYGALLKWLWSILWRSPAKIPQGIRFAWFSVWAIILLSLGLLLFTIGPLQLGAAPFWIWLAIIAVLVVVNGVLLNTVADAARYLDTRPSSVEARYAIQKCGVELIERLHKSNRDYERIIVVSHSLGTVIGYDVLQYAWQRFRTRYVPQPLNRQKAVDTLRNAIKGDMPLDDYRTMQSDLLAENIGNGNAWRISDYITLGSPLAHAALLLAKDEDDLRARQRGRELATCPPTRDEKFGITDDITMPKPDGTTRDVRTLDHASPFAVVRWTNGYFRSLFALDGDVISGPVAPVFGKGVRDVALRSPARGWLTHLFYWTHRNDADRQPTDPMAMLREALALDPGREVVAPTPTPPPAP